MLTRPHHLLGLLLFAVAGIACTSASSQNDAQSDAQTDDAPSGPVPGKVDDHCTFATPVMVNQAACDGAADAGIVPPGTVPPVRYNAAGDDDDCKYHVSFTSSPVAVNEDVTFKVAATLLDPAAQGGPATGAAVQIEGYLADVQFHVIPNTAPTTSEDPAGSGDYVITPVKFDVSGRWVVRFHLYEDCAGLSGDSPHGHIAFYLDVP